MPWRKTIEYVLKRIVSADVVQRTAEGVEHVLFGTGALNHNETTKRIVELVTAFQGQPTEAAIDAGPLIFFQVDRGDGTFAVFAKILTKEDRKFLDANPMALASPRELLVELQNAREVSRERLDEIEHFARSPSSENGQP